MDNNLINEYIQWLNEYIQWLKDNGKAVCKIKNISYDDLKYAVTVKLNMELNKPLKQNMPKNKKTTTVTYIGMKTDTFTFYQCDDCGCTEVLSNSYYCPNCGKKII